MSVRRSMPRSLPRKNSASVSNTTALLPFDAPRRIRRTTIDFGALKLPPEVRLALAEAFWSHIGIWNEAVVLHHWFHIRTFERFAIESGSIATLRDLNGVMLSHYIEWLNAQARRDGTPWSKSSKSRAYVPLRTLLKWLQRCRPDVLSNIEYPYNPFPLRNRDAKPRNKVDSHLLRSILRACEKEITQMRARREALLAQRKAGGNKPGSLAWLIDEIEHRAGGIIPTEHLMEGPGWYSFHQAFKRHGGLEGVQPYLYPRGNSLLPYYLAILIHAAGNPDAIRELRCDCLQPLPMLEDREVLVWFKARSNKFQRRAFSRSNTLEPPALVREVIAWNERLRASAPPSIRDRLFLYMRHSNSVAALGHANARNLLALFCKRHNLPRFSISSIRPGVLTSFYKATRDLRQVSAIANHAHLSTTIRYVVTPEVEAQHRSHIAALQNTFIGHVRSPHSSTATRPTMPRPDGRSLDVPAGEVVSMFGFGCRDPVSGTAPGTRRGELCTHFLGCFTCPNAIITPDPLTLARLLQARDHLRAATATIHPARWQVFYAPQLHILEEDILTRFSSAELAAAEPFREQLAPLPDLR
jgi:hypothetical protein